LYNDSDLKKIKFIKHAQVLGFTLREIKDLLTLRVDPETTCEDVRLRAERKIVDIENKLKELQRMKKALLKLTAACAGTGPTGDCPILEALEATKK
jgi:MerR family mercuric resistance operon transcriptional regulator